MHFVLLLLLPLLLLGLLRSCQLTTSLAATWTSHYITINQTSPPMLLLLLSTAAVS
jgi:hypothetical protein